MAHFAAALALAGALIPFAPAPMAEPAIHIAQMARDVTDAIRKQRAQRRAQADAPINHAASGKKR